MEEGLPAVLPIAEMKILAPHISLLPPLSRTGYGPGLIIILPNGTPLYEEGGTICLDGVPPPLLKWAEEGFAVVQILESAFEDANDPNGPFTLATSALKDCKQCYESGGIGLIVYDAGCWNRTVSKATLPSSILTHVIYGSATDPAVTTSSTPTMQHLVGAPDSAPVKTVGRKVYYYPSSKSTRFAITGHEDFEHATEAVSHTRNLTFLKTYIRGADFDLEEIWDEHTYFEFADRSVPKVMATMVQEPYVNHIPTLTGGIGRSRLSNFYQDHFIFTNPKDTSMELVSRTIGIDRICDEFIFRFTHDREIDWLIPGIPPTGIKLEIPFTAVVNVRGDRLYHEHIAWDQASVLKQLGLLPEYLPYPHPLPDGRKPAPGKQFEYKLPVAGAEAALKMLNKNSVESNFMFAHNLREVDRILSKR